MNESTVLYRQHGNNEVGAHKYRSLDFIKREASLRQDFQNMLRNNIPLDVIVDCTALSSEEIKLIANNLKW